ncbi:histidine phosphatase family protein [Patulibacter sp. SYSU D01012]|uniref:histidine phosphatase family protein n=1 Tax=Patulibacter sp. SYSU D01012 TaxID=2817381 RepID=UPI001B309C5E
MSTQDAEKPRSTEHAQRLFVLPKDATEVVLVRHGATQGMVDGQPFDADEDGHGNPPLSPDGEEQARLVGDRLYAEPVDYARLFVTTLRRTHQTAARFAALTGLEPEPIRDLREIHLGEWELGEYRRRIADRDPLIVRSFLEQRWGVIPGAEQDEDFAARVRRGFDEIVARSGPGVSVVAVVHGGVIAEMCRQATGSEAFAFLGADNTSLNRFIVFGDGRVRLRTFNDTGHLDALRARARSAGEASEPLV